MAYFQVLTTPDWLHGLEHLSLSLRFLICKMEGIMPTWTPYVKARLLYEEHT